MLPQRGSKFISLCFRESAWFGLHVTSQGDGVHYFGLDCQHPSLSSHLKTTVLNSSTMCGMFNRSEADHDYQYQVIGCNKSLPYVCEETQSGLFFQYFIKSLSLSLSLSLCVSVWFACLFVWGFTSHSRFFHIYGDVTITGEGLQMLTYARHLWPLSSEGSLNTKPSTCEANDLTDCVTAAVYMYICSKGDIWYLNMYMIWYLFISKPLLILRQTFWVNIHSY